MELEEQWEKSFPKILTLWRLEITENLSNRKSARNYAN